MPTADGHGKRWQACWEASAVWWTGRPSGRGLERAGVSAASRNHRGVAKRLGMTGARRWRVPAQALVEHELGGAADKAVDLEGWKSPHRQLPGFGRLAYPQHGAGNQP